MGRSNGTTFLMRLQLFLDLERLVFGNEPPVAVVVIDLHIKTPIRDTFGNPIPDGSLAHGFDDRSSSLDVKVTLAIDDERSLDRSSFGSKWVIAVLCHPETKRHSDANFKGGDLVSGRGFHTGPSSQADGWFCGESEVA